MVPSPRRAVKIFMSNSLCRAARQRDARCICMAVGSRTDGFTRPVKSPFGFGTTPRSGRAGVVRISLSIGGLG